MPERMEVRELERKFDATLFELNEVEQILGKALGYPRYVDDPENFPEATAADGVCVGELTPIDLAEQIAKLIISYETERKNKIFIPIHLRGCILSTIQKSRNFLVDLLERTEEKFPAEERRIRAIQREFDGWRAEIAEYNEVLAAIVGNDGQTPR